MITEEQRKVLNGMEIHIINKYLKEERNTAFIMWQTEDVIYRAKVQNIDVTEDQAREVISDLNRRADCTLGITWGTLDIYIDEVLNPYQFD